MVARSFFLFVGRILFLVDDDKSQVADRSEDRRTRADHHARISAFDAMPLLGALLIRQRRMEDGHFIAEHLVQIGGNRRREPDLGNQQDRGAASLEYRAHRGEIDGSLPRPGNAMQQDPAELARCYAFLNLFQRVLLGGVEFEFKRRPARLDAGDVELGRFLDDIDQAALDEGVERGARDVAVREASRHRHGRWPGSVH